MVQLMNSGSESDTMCRTNNKLSVKLEYEDSLEDEHGPPNKRSKFGPRFQQCVSRYEGDLVAKCYFAKHKLVWEVLDGGLKSKMEIQWSDILDLKANCPETGPGTLDIVAPVMIGEFVNDQYVLLKLRTIGDICTSGRMMDVNILANE